MHSDRTCARLRWCAAVCLIAVTAVAGTAQEPWEDWNWGAQASVKFLYNPAWQIEFERNEVRFLSRKLTYVFLPSSSRWLIQPEAHEWEELRIGRISTSEGILEAVPQSERERKTEGIGRLRLRWTGSAEPFTDLVLWTREQLGRAWFEQAKKISGRPPATPEALAAELHVAEPRIADWDEDSQSIWLAIRFYAGEGSAGLGSIVEIDKSTHEARLHQPAELAHFSVSRIAALGDELRLATDRFLEGGMAAGIGIVRYIPQTREVKTIPPDQFVGSYVTAMAQRGGVLWVVTDEGFTRFDLGSGRRRSWRVVPKVEIDRATPVSDLPGGDPRGELPPGEYEVRWVGQGYLEILTPSCTQGLIKRSQFEYLIQWDFWQSPGVIAEAPKWGNPGALALHHSPVPNHFQARPSAWFLRVPAVATGEKLGDWQVVRACAGWVELPADRVHLSIERQD